MTSIQHKLRLNSMYGVLSEKMSLEKMYHSKKIIATRYCSEKEKFINGLDEEVIFEIIKNRHGVRGKTDMVGAIDTISEMLADYKFQGRNKLFQNSLKDELKETLTKILIGER